MTIGILFDLDGTLLNTLEDLKDATNYALSSLGYPEGAWRRSAASWATERAGSWPRPYPQG